MDYSRKENWTVQTLEQTLSCYTVLQPDELGNFNRLWKAKTDCERNMGITIRPLKEESRWTLTQLHSPDV